MEKIIEPVVFLCIILLGYAFKRIGWVKSDDYKIMQKIVFNLLLPAAVVVSFINNEHDLRLLWVALFGFCASVIPILTIYLFTGKTPLGNRAFYMLNGSGFNIGCFALPVVQALMGPGPAVAVVMFDIGNSVMMSAGMNAVTTQLLRIDDTSPLTPEEQARPLGPRPPRKVMDKDARRLQRRANLRRIARNFYSSAAFMTYMLMLVFMITGFAIPHWVGTVLQPFSNANAFCSMFMVGMLMDVPHGMKDVKPLAVVFAWRWAFAFIFSAAAWFILPVDPEIRKAVIFVCFAPVGVFSTLFTDRVLGNARLAGLCLATTGTLGLIAMTVANLVIPV
ncbi:AEC family transporter [Bifidobacterium callimiconis]|uniref:Permease n=1 Tax=Bifidobacterium callimiconis TaxID=2306973 RepID=A0A430F738_9BIFI|nr:AEC family transporter [Bifidobacterium callimiconis]MBT1177091.1 AEC family transporter [Bifidobacterium callimiconis]RSX47813.1 permease [Bifidobacterium callimiconis]